VVVAIPNKEALTVSRAIFDHWVCKFSVPKVLISDRGKEFDNQILNELCVLLGVEKRMTSVMHPQANTAVESWNRSLVKYLTTACSGGSTLEWESYLPALALCYNTAVHKSTLHSPFYLTFLHQPNLPYFDIDEPVNESLSWPSTAFLRMNKAYKLAKINMDLATDIGKEYYDRKAKVPQEFEVGDRVLVFFPKGMNKDNKKISEQWRDGYTVLKRTGPISYLVQCGPHAKPHAAQINRIKPDPTQSAVTDGPLRRPLRPSRQLRRSSVSLDEGENEDDPVLPAVGPAALPVPILLPAPLPAMPPPPVLQPGHMPIQPPPAAANAPAAVNIPAGAEGNVREGRLDRLARDLFDPQSRQLRSRGPADEHPRVQPRILERKQ
jgi:hypothetical protein